MTGLKRRGTTRKCKNCAIEESQKGTHEECVRCDKHPDSSMNWRPDLDTCKEIVLSYIKQRSHISAAEIAAIDKIPVVVVEGAIAQLVKDGVLKTQTSVVVVE
jgi:predicted HTH transcriptional regulator